MCALEGANREAPTPHHESRITNGESRTANREPRYATLDDFLSITAIRRDELATLAEIGALNAFGYDRRSALWQIEKAVRPKGELFDEAAETSQAVSPMPSDPGSRPSTRRPVDPASRGGSGRWSHCALTGASAHASTLLRLDLLTTSGS